jgi:hypothetical protein
VAAAVLALLLLALAAAPAHAAGKLVSRGADGDSTAVAVSDGGRFVLFNSRADNLSRVDYDHRDQARQSTGYVRDMRTGRLALVGYNRRNRVVDDVVSANDMTPDGRFVVFSSPAANLGGPGVFVRDMRRRRTRRVGLGYGGGVISDDGRVVAALVDGRLSVLRRGRTRLIHAPPSGVRAILSFAISGDGRFVSYSVGPYERPRGGETTTVEVFRASTRTGRSRRVQRDTYGENLQAFGVPLSFDGRYLATLRPASPFDVLRHDLRGGTRVVNRCAGGLAVGSGPSMSADGRRVAWTAGPVHVADVARCQVWRIGEDAFGAVLSADGRWVAFSARDEGIVNAYIARVA